MDVTVTCALLPCPHATLRVLWETQAMNPDQEEAGRQLERVLASEQFQGSSRLSRFLRVVADRALAGEGDRLKEFVIGIEVFDRDEHYDPRVDSIVRVEAGRLRTRLEQYFQGPGRHDPLLIRLPKGSYVPVFEAMPPQAASPSPARKPSAGTWIAVLAFPLALSLALAWFPRSTSRTVDPDAVAVLPFVPVHDSAEDLRIAAALTAGVTQELVARGDLAIVPQRNVSAVLATQSVQQAAGQLGAGWLVEARVLRNAEFVQLELRIANAARNRKLWVHTYGGQSGELEALSREAAQGVAAALAQNRPQETSR